jgi:adenosine deaminase/aminodeoxyfutalosine deaminase
MRDALLRLDKAELHVHLEGSVRPATLREIVPDLSEAEIEEHYEYEDFAGFLAAFKWVTGYLRKPSDYGLITRRLIEELSAQNVRYAEINVSAGVMLWRNQDLESNFLAIREAANGFPVRFLFDAVRQFGVEHVHHVAEWAVRLKPLGVAGFGVGGDEQRGPVEAFRETLDWVRGEGLAVLPHAGETAGPESIWRALEAGAVRIGHGIRAVEDPVLLEHLAARDIPLEISISSNVRTGAVGHLRDHPVRRIYDAGVPVVLNTDDPAMFKTTLVLEYEIAAREFGFSLEELAGMARNGFRYALSEEIRSLPPVA